MLKKSDLGPVLEVVTIALPLQSHACYLALGNQLTFTTTTRIVAISYSHAIVICNPPDGFQPAKSMGEAGFTLV